MSAIAGDPSEAVQSRTGYLLYGPTGSGKSSAVAVLHRFLVSRQLMAQWVECGAMPGDPIEAEDELERVTATTAFVVFFDDLGKELEHHRKRMSGVIMARHLMPARLDIFTTNLNVHPTDPHQCEFAEVYGEHARSRVWGLCGRNIVEFNGQDFRTRV